MTHDIREGMKMAHHTIYLSYSPQEREHGLAVGRLLHELEYAYVESGTQSRMAVSRCSTLLRVRVPEDMSDPTFMADTAAFISRERSSVDSRIVDLILAPGYAVWPEQLSLPVIYVNAVTQVYADWTRDLELALSKPVSGMGTTFGEDYNGHLADDNFEEDGYDGSYCDEYPDDYYPDDYY